MQRVRSDDEPECFAMYVAVLCAVQKGLGCRSRRPKSVCSDGLGGRTVDGRQCGNLVKRTNAEHGPGSGQGVGWGLSLHRTQGTDFMNDFDDDEGDEKAHIAASRVARYVLDRQQWYHCFSMIDHVYATRHSLP